MAPMRRCSAATGGCGWRPACSSPLAGIWRPPRASTRRPWPRPPAPWCWTATGRILRLGLEAQGRKLITLPAGELPEKVAAAFVAAEDQRFWRHPGVDPLAVLRALTGNLSAGRIVSGASTITMQLARLTYPGTAHLLPQAGGGRPQPQDRAGL